MNDLQKDILHIKKCNFPINNQLELITHMKRIYRLESIIYLIGNYIPCNFDGEVKYQIYKRRLRKLIH